MPRIPAKFHKSILVRLGQNVRAERRRKGLSQEALAELVDLHPRVLQKIEKGQTNILVTTVIRIQSALLCPWSQLLPDATKQHDEGMQRDGLTDLRE